MFWTHTNNFCYFRGKNYTTSASNRDVPLQCRGTCVEWLYIVEKKINVFKKSNYGLPYLGTVEKTKLLYSRKINSEPNFIRIFVRSAKWNYSERVRHCVLVLRKYVPTQVILSVCGRFITCVWQNILTPNVQIRSNIEPPRLYVKQIIE